MPIFSWGIRAFQGTEFSHTYIKFYSSYYEEWMYFQASGTMVNFMSEEMFYKQNEVVEEFTIPICKEAKRQTIKKCIQKLGIPYGKLQILGIFLEKFGVENRWKDGDHTYICSELIAEILKEIVKIDNSRSLDNLIPLDLYNILVKWRNNGIS